MGRAAGSNSGTAEFGGYAISDELSYEDRGFKSPADGLSLGGQVGHNWRAGTFLLGFEADAQWSNAQAGQTSDFVSQRWALPWLATARGRAGYASDTWLLYVTGGLATGGVEYQFIPIADGLSHDPVDKRLWGWTLGAGAEVAIWPGMSTRLEYLFVDLGEFKTTSTGSGATANWSDVSYSNMASAQLSEHLVRFGINVQFGR